MLLDSNAIIYSIKPEFSRLRAWIAEHGLVVSVVSYVEVLGYHRLSASDQRDFMDFFNSARMIPVAQGILDQAVHLRQQRKMSLGDSIIAATAIIHQFPLITANTNDFQWIQDLKLLNPLVEP